MGTPALGGTPALPEATPVRPLSAHLGPTHAVNHVMPADARDLLGQALEPARLALIRRPMVKEPIRSSLRSASPMRGNRAAASSGRGRSPRPPAGRLCAAIGRCGRAPRSAGPRPLSASPMGSIACRAHRPGRRGDGRTRQRRAEVEAHRPAAFDRSRQADMGALRLAGPMVQSRSIPTGLTRGAARSGSPWSEAASSPGRLYARRKAQVSWTCKSS
jgi:hypothetical protein